MPFPTVVDDDGTGTTGTVLDKAFFDAYNAEIAARDSAAIAPSGSSYTSFADTGTIDLALPAEKQIRTMVYTGGAGCTIRSIAGPAVIGDMVIIKNYGGAPVLLKHGHTTPVMINIATSADTPVAPNGFALFINTGGSSWMLIAHDQGSWIAPVFSAANFFGGGTMTWTLAAGDVTVLRYRLSGKTMTVTFRLDNTSVGGTLDPTLQIGNAAWGGFTVSVAQSNGGGRALDAGALVAIFITAVNSVVQIQKTSVANWALSTDSTVVYGQVTFEVN